MLLPTSIFFALGALIASFITVVSERIYTGQSWSRGRSRCNSCNTELTARDLIPVLSWIRTLGKCRYCRSALPAAYLFVELSVGILFVLAYLKLGIGTPLFVFLVTLCVLTFIVLYDLRHTVVSPAASLLLFLLASIFAVLTDPDLSSLGLTIMLAGMIGLFIFLIYALSRGRAMGLGDTPIVFSLALLVGGAHAFSGLLFSFWVGAVISIVILLARRGGPTMGVEVPFVPFLAVGFLLAYFTQWNPFPLPLF